MSKTKHVVLKLTRLEAKAILAAARNSVGDREDAYAVLVTGSSVQAAYRAVDKLREAIYGK